MICGKLTGSRWIPLAIKRYNEVHPNVWIEPPNSKMHPLIAGGALLHFRGCILYPNNLSLPCKKPLLSTTTKVVFYCIYGQNQAESGFGAVDRLLRSPVFCVQEVKAPENAGVLLVFLYAVNKSQKIRDSGSRTREKSKKAEKRCRSNDFVKWTQWNVPHSGYSGAFCVRAIVLSIEKSARKGAFAIFLPVFYPMP